jgi:hypothetical protein
MEELSITQRIFSVLMFRQFKSEVQQELMGEDKILRMVFDSQEIFWVDG